MGVVTFVRPKRANPPAMPRGDLLLESPPEIPPPAGARNFGGILRMLPMVAGAGAMALMMSQSAGKSGLSAVMGGMYGVSMLGMMVTQMGRGNDDTAGQLDASRRDYFRYLGQTRKKVREAAAAQRRGVLWRHPEPESLWTLAGHRRMWERRADADDFVSIRIAEGPQQFSQRITPPESKPVEDLEPLTTGALRRFIRTHRTVAGVPLALNLKGFSQVQLVGDQAACRMLGYAMIAQLAAWQAPTDLRILCCAAPDVRDQWEWMKWLPHLQHPTRRDGVGQVRMLATTAHDLAAVGDGAIGGEDPPAHLIMVVDGVAGVAAASMAGQIPSTTIEVTSLHERPRRIEAGVAVLEVQRGTMMLHRRQPSGQIARTPLGRPDQLSLTAADQFARQLAPYRMPVRSVAEADSGEENDEAVVFEPPKDYPSMVGVPDPITMDPRTCWKLRPMPQRLRVPIGNGEGGRPVELDIKESALGGMGPHGICIGATGSGKSEFLRTLVLGLVMTHSSEHLNLVLVDFKGGATFAGLDQLPHVSAFISNLEGESTLVDRMQDALAGEMERRMEVLRAAGNFKNREDYEQARMDGADMPPMPSLFIIVDEFSELLAARPEFIELFIQIGRIGRSVAVHQLLASQRLEEGKLRGLDTFLSYRIALRTFSPAESRVVIGVPDAYELPSPPGNGYLKFDTTSMTRFKAAYVSGTWEGANLPVAAGSTVDPLSIGGSLVTKQWVPPVLEFEPGHVDQIEPPEPEHEPEPEPTEAAGQPAKPAKAKKAAEEEDKETLLGIVVSRLKGHGWPAHQVWLPPLDDPPTMDTLLRSELVETERGLTTADTRLHGRLMAAVALVDRPRQQRRDPMWLDFSGSAGNTAVIGGPQSGKSMAVRALISGLALTHTPEEVGFYCLDFGGGSLASLRELPHVGSVCSRLDVDRVRRTIAEMTTLLQAREVAFAELGIDSMTSYRRGRRDGSIPADRFAADVFLVVDGWGTMRSEFEEQEVVLTNLAARALGFGIHLVGTANKWSDFRIAIRDLLQGRVELRLGDAFESEIDRKRAALVPAGRPGRGLSPDGMHMMIGLPRIDGVEDADDVSEGCRAMVTRMKAAWRGAKAAAVRMLPDDLPYAALPQVGYHPTDKTIPIGIDELELSTVWLDPNADPHFVLFGAPESGKSTVLRAILAGVVKRYTPKEAKIMILDYRRALLGFVETEHMLGYAASSEAGKQLMSDAAAAVRQRLPGPEVTQQQLRDRSWWKGSELFVVVDDYELVATSTGNALAPLIDLVSQASDIGLHIIMARGMGGAGRAFFGDPIVQRMKDAANPGLIMSGNRDEGALFGNVRPSALPPGRGTLVSRNGIGLVQLANLPPKE